jgi:hypothetical protein
MGLLDMWRIDIIEKVFNDYLNKLHESGAKAGNSK